MDSSNQETLVLAGDIGGTKTNLGLFGYEAERPELKAFDSYPSEDFSSLENVVSRFLQDRSVDVVAACFGIAGPVREGVVKTTNLPWKVSEDRLRHQFGWDMVMLVNDLVATAYSIQVLDHGEIVELHSGDDTANGTIGIAAPGTGLGMAILMSVCGEMCALPSEGGHMDFSPKNQIEIDLLQYLQGRHSHASVERLVSGPGIATIYDRLKAWRSYAESKWLRTKLENEDRSKVISEAAINQQDSLCVETMDIFVSILGSVVGSLALVAMTTGGMYLGGGICPQILPILRKGGFLEAFFAKGRFRGFMESIPVRVITNDKAALLGAAYHARALLTRNA